MIPPHRMVLESDAPYIDAVPWQATDLLLPMAVHLRMRPEILIMMLAENIRTLYRI